MKFDNIMAFQGGDNLMYLVSYVSFLDILTDISSY